MASNKMMGVLAVTFALATSSVWASPAELHTTLLNQTQQEINAQLASDIRRNASIALTQSTGEAELAAQQDTDDQMHARKAPQMPEVAQFPWSECNS